jgi:cobalt-zinc-cadmium efflux system outer membrane protein
VTLPAWNRIHVLIGEADAAVRQASAEANLLRLELNSALESAYRRYQLAGRQVAVYDDGVLRSAEAALRAAEAAFRFGERGVMEVLDAQRVLRAARLEFLNAQYDRESALIDIEQLRTDELREGMRRK